MAGHKKRKTEKYGDYAFFHLTHLPKKINPKFEYQNYNHEAHEELLNKKGNKMTIELTQQRSRLLRHLPRQTPRNDKRGCLCEQSEAIS
jgi:hypothetical protein